MSNNANWYVALVGMAQAYRDTYNIKECIRCLQAIFTFKPPVDIESRTHLQLGTILREHTNNADLAKHHLEQAWYLGQNAQPAEIKLEAATLLASVLEKEGNVADAKKILVRALELAQEPSYWKIRLLFQLADIHYKGKDLNSAHAYLQSGVDTCQMTGSNYSKCLFLLSKVMLYLSERKFTDANPILQQLSPEIESWANTYANQDQVVILQQKEYLQLFYLVLQVCYYLLMGQVKSVKGTLKSLQSSVQTVTSPEWPADNHLTKSGPGDQFIWMPREHLVVLVYLITVMHSMQGGYMDKAERYTEKAVQQITELQQQSVSTGNDHLLSVMHVMLVEHIIQCRLVQGEKLKAVKDIVLMCRLMQDNPLLLQNHRAQLHTLLGLYAMSMNCPAESEAQFNAALRTSRESELWTFANLNLAILYLRSNRVQEFQGLLSRISPDSPHIYFSHCLKAAAFFVHGLQAFSTNVYGDAKKYLRETLKMANAEDLNRLISCSLALLGHIFLAMGNQKEAMNMVTPALQLSSKIPDLGIQLWASAILKDLYRQQNDPVKAEEGQEQFNKFNQALMQDYFSATHAPEHAILQWTDGPFPVLQ